MEDPKNHDRPADDHGVTPAAGVHVPPVTDTPGATPAGPRGDAPADEAHAVPLSPGAWLAQNGVWLVLIVGGLVWLYRSQGWEGLPRALYTIVGIGFIIFIHELGHFLAAKWCDVHVMTFSVGFGPAIPGCSYRRGETTYKLALFPLGGYVNMVGEGNDDEVGEDYPRSFRNKTVGQRMVIISAGVVMNVVFGVLGFFAVSYFHGFYRTNGVVDKVEPGGVAWLAGVRPGMEIESIDSTRDPSFDTMQRKVGLSGKGKKRFGFRDPHTGEVVEKDLEPRKDDGLPTPRIGISGPHRLELPSGAAARKRLERPVARRSPAGAARVVPFQPGDRVTAASDPDEPNRLTALDADDWSGDLGRRMVALAGKSMKVLVKGSGGKEREEALAEDGFDFGDRIVATTAPGGEGYDPFRLEPLPVDPRSKTEDARDPFEFRRRMYRLAGKTVALRVRRHDSAAEATILVPGAFHAVPGMRMKMGEVAAVRKDSPADKAGLLGKGTHGRAHTITDVTMKTKDGKTLYFASEDADKVKKHQKEGATALDPVRLPFELRRAASKAGGAKQVWLHVAGVDPKGQTRSIELPAMAWDDSDERDDPTAEVLTRPESPLSVAELGLAYWVRAEVAAVDPKSPASRAMLVQQKDGVTVRGPLRWNGATGLRPGDVITQARFWSAGAKGSAWGDWLKLEEDNDAPLPAYAYLFELMQLHGTRGVQLMLAGGKDEDRKEKSEVGPVELVLEEDASWPDVERGLPFVADRRLYRTDTLLGALREGLVESYEMTASMYTGLVRLLTNRVSVKTLGGPIEIVSQTYTASEDFYSLLMLLAVLSINLAVVNFLPIPLLDGGHMVFLIYEKIRGKPPSDGVRAFAAYLGLALLLSLMIFVFYQDITRLWFK